MKNKTLYNLDVVSTITALIEKGVVGNAKSYSDLLTYLAERSISDNSSPPKEMEIAQDVFNKTDFSQLTDSSVRVYVHNLRKKLESYYQNEGSEDALIFYIPKGSYTLKWKDKNTNSVLETSQMGSYKLSKRLLFQISLIALCLSVLTGFLGFNLGKKNNDASGKLEKSPISDFPIWQEIRSNSFPTIIVVGDFYYFAESNSQTNKTRMVRQFDINNDEDFDEKIVSQQDTKSGEILFKSPLRYFGKGSVFSLPFITKELQGHTAISLKMSSDLTPDDIRENNIVYIGSYKSLAVLQEIYNGTPFQLEKDFGHLRDTRNGTAYYVQGDANAAHTDYGIYTQHTSSSGNIILTFASFTETALLQMAEQLTAPNVQLPITGGKANTKDSVLFFTVSGHNRTNIETNLVMMAPLDQTLIWAK